MTALYLDTSALVKLYVAEAESEKVHEAIEKAERAVTSTVAYAELRAALGRRRRIGDLDEEGYRRAIGKVNAEWRGFVRISVSNLVAYRAGEMAGQYALRGFDAIHLASAERFGERFSGLKFLAFDSRLMQAACEASVPVYEEA
ncbi:MAG: type II toxin-antitoxin system VapC family toxin [Rubrobacteraceae bacterium]